jgi:hypothetical protein
MIGAFRKLHYKKGTFITGKNMTTTIYKPTGKAGE